MIPYFPGPGPMSCQSAPGWHYWGCTDNQCPDYQLEPYNQHDSQPTSI
ncbi:unnamed protein product, partial [Staurois parvus]